MTEFMRPNSRVASASCLSDLAFARGRALCAALGLEARTDEILGVCSRLLEPWGGEPLAPEPEWRSHVVDDGTPFEFSVAFGKQPELRFMVEPLGSPPSLATNVARARALLASLAKSYPIDLSRFERVADLFLPEAPRGVFGLWVAAGFSARGGPELKLYLDPQASGSARAPGVVEEALSRLGFDGAWPVIGNVLASRGPVLDELKYFSLDLSKTPEARVKVYARHHFSTPDVVAYAATGCPSAEPDSIRRFLATVSPDRSDYSGRGPFTCYAFVEGRVTPDSVTTHFPINGYAANDAVVSERVRACLEEFGLPGHTYAKALMAIADRPLAQRVGLTSYVSFRRRRDETRITLYLPTEAYAPGTVEDPRNPASGMSMRIDAFAGFELEQHPFVARLLREPLTTLPLLQLVRAATAALEDERAEVRALAATLDAPEHVELVETFVATPAEHVDAQLEWLSLVAASLPPDPAGEPDSSAPAAGRRFRERLREQRQHSDPRRRIGAGFAGALFAGEVCAVVGRRLRQHADFAQLPTLRAPAFPAWSLSDQVGEDAYVDVFAGVRGCAVAAWTLLNELYEGAYGAGTATS